MNVINRIACIALVGSCLAGQEADSAWRDVSPNVQQEHVGFRLIKVQGIATMGQQSKSAILYLFGKPKSRRFTIGLYFGELDKEWAGVRWDDFRGPDLSKVALGSTPLKFEIRQGTKTVTAKYRMIVSGVVLPKTEVGQLAEGILVSSTEDKHIGPSPHAMVKAMVGGYQSLQVLFSQPKGGGAVSFDFPNSSGNEVLQNFIDAIGHE